MKNKGNVAVGEVACLREQVVKEPHLGEPPEKGQEPEGNKSSAGGGPGQSSKSKKDGNRRKRNKGRS